MGKVGVVSILTGIATLIGFFLYAVLSEGEIPWIIKGALMLIFVGVVLVLSKQIIGYQGEKKEKEEYKDL